MLGRFVRLATALSILVALVVAAGCNGKADSGHDHSTHDHGR